MQDRETGYIDRDLFDSTGFYVGHYDDRGVNAGNGVAERSESLLGVHKEDTDHATVTTVDASLDETAKDTEGRNSDGTVSSHDCKSPMSMVSSNR